MIGNHFSREAFESQSSLAERRLLVRELGRELQESLNHSAHFEDGLSALLARLRLIGHHLYVVKQENGHRVLAGNPAGDEPVSGLEIEIEGTTLNLRYCR